MLMEFKFSVWVISNGLTLGWIHISRSYTAISSVQYWDGFFPISTSTQIYGLSQAGNPKVSTTFWRSSSTTFSISYLNVNDSGNVDTNRFEVLYWDI